MKKLLSLFVLMVALSFANSMMAQPPDPGGGGGELPNCFPPPCVPIDGGLSWLLIAGVAYGGKKVYELNKDEKEEI